MATVGLTQYASQHMLDNYFPTTGASHFIAYCTGTFPGGPFTEATALTRTNIGATGWAAATAADPSVKGNSTSLTSAAATAAATITGFAVFDASTSGNQLTEWTALSSSRTVAVGDQLTWAVGALQITLT